MYIEQPYSADTLSRINESELTVLVNRYIITKYAYLLSTKRLNKKRYVNGPRVVNAVQLMPVDEAADIPDFKYPFYNSDKKWIAFDARRLYSYDKKRDEFQIRRSMDIDFANMCNDLTGLWVVDYSRQMRDLTLPMIAFGEWLSSLITKSFGLEPVHKETINMLSIIYYRRMFDKPDEKNEDELLQLKVKLGGYIYNEDILDRVHAETKEMSTLNEFCEAISTVTGNPRLHNFNRGVLHRITRTGWMGMDNKENIEIALQYPPFWIAMCYSSLQKNLYSRTTIGDTMMRLSKRGRGTEFVNGVLNLIRLGVEEE